MINIEVTFITRPLNTLVFITFIYETEVLMNAKHICLQVWRQFAQKQYLHDWTTLWEYSIQCVHKYIFCPVLLNICFLKKSLEIKILIENTICLIN